MLSLKRLLQRQDGQDLIEYGLLISLIAIGAIGAVGLLGDTINTFYWASIGASI